MDVDRRRAVVASAFRSDAMTLCAQLSELGFREVAYAADGFEALGLVRDLRPDALIADAVLPSLDGSALIRRINAMPLTVVPAMVLMIVPGMELCRGRISGACALLEKPTDLQSLSTALASMSPEKRPVDQEVLHEIETILVSLGIPEHPGREYLMRAVWLARQDARMLNALTTRLYPAVAEAYCVNRRQAERAMRHAIDVAWRSGEMEAQYRIFGDTIDARRGNPTCGEMIAQIADILRWEGNA